MVIVHPIAVIVLPLAALSVYRRRWAFLFLLFSVPFFSLEVVIAASHPFNPPEIALLVLGGHITIEAVRNSHLSLPNAQPLLLLWGFLGAATLSVIWAVVNPTSVLVHPYRLGFPTFRFVESFLTFDYVSQLLLRVFFVAAVTVICVYLVRSDQLVTAVRGVIYGAVAAGIVGIVYQAAFVLQFSALPMILEGIGFGDFPTNPGMMGPIPRMFSLPGEPGFTADLLLYALAVTTTLMLVPGPNRIFGTKEVRGLTLFLAMALLLSTGTTGYGGLVIMVPVLSGLMILFPTTRPRNSRRKILQGTAISLILVIGVFLVVGPTLLDILARQIEKLTFQTGSGSVRLRYIRRSVDVFLARPLLGVGVGAHRVPSYLMTLLAETGIVGAILLIGGQVYAFRQCAGLISRNKDDIRPAAAALAVGGTTLLVTNLIAKSISTLLMPWYWFAVALPIAYVAIHSSSILTSRERDSMIREEGASAGDG